MQLGFVKMHGIGNDFVVVDDLDGTLDLDATAVEWICDRHFGVGADGVIVVRRATSPDADLYMHFFNADGTLAEMCGNGIRCLVKHAVDTGIVPSDAESVAVETLAGIKRVSFERDDAGLMTVARVDMGVPGLTPDAIPVDLTGDIVYDCPLETPYGTVRITAVSMGNPHAVIWVDDVDAAPVDTVGPAVETHPAFPKRTNVEFAELVDDTRIRVRVWERGVGETLACGTGACATVVAAVLSCRTGRSATVELPGGELDIRWHEDDHVYLTGPATTVFTGSIDIPEE
ncbi:MAG: diaminopimelate epimerase [Anaerosomatales bacterium]|nr:diaminopimelate epimerase [Anaerosomatales bacterium]